MTVSHLLPIEMCCTKLYDDTKEANDDITRVTKCQECLEYDARLLELSQLKATLLKYKPIKVIK